MKSRTISEATVRRCLLLRHRNATKSFPNDTVYILSKIVTEIVKEILYRLLFRLPVNCLIKLELFSLANFINDFVNDSYNMIMS